MKYTLSDLIDIPKMQKLTDSFFEATGIPSSIITNDGTILTGPGWENLCINFYRKHPESKKACKISHEDITERISAGAPYVICKCPYGFMNATAPIMVEGNYLGNFSTGHFLYHKPNEDEIACFKQQVAKFGFDEAAYLNAVCKIPIIPEERIGSVLVFLVRLAEMGLTHLNQKKTSLALQKAHAQLKKEIKERNRVDQELRSHLEFMQILLDTIPDPVYYKDAGGVYQGCNKMFSNHMLGLPKEKIIGRELLELDCTIPADLAKVYHEQDQKLFAKPGLQSYESQIRCADGKKRYFLFRKAVYRNSTDGDTGIVGIMVDITDRKKSEKALHESEKRYRSLQENLPVGLFRTVLDGKILAVNPATVKMLKYESVDDLMAVSAYDLYAEPERRQVFLDRLKAEGKIEDFEVKFKRKDGTVFWMSISAILVTDPDGNFTYIDGMLQDVTERILTEIEKSKLQDQLRQAQKMEAIGTLAGGIAHDFNNILTAIMGYTEISQSEVEKGSRLHKYLEEVIKASERAKDLVQQILTFSRQSKQELKPVQMKLIAREALGLLRAVLPATIEIHQDLRSNATVLANPTQIHQVLMNLCANAAYAMREKGGELEVKLVDAELDSAAVAPYPDLKSGFYLKLTVRDSGHGMPPHVLSRIFDPFFTTKEKGEGSGMGLSVVHGIVKSYGGSITVQSDLGKGTVFTILLPVMERFTEMGTPEDEPIPKGTERLLFVDDEKPVADLGYHMLTALGYDVVTKTSGIEALELFGEERDRFDLVITDMTMPKMTGVELSREIMRIKPDIPIILCTGFSDMIDEKKADEIGLRAFVLKPIQLRNMAETIRRVLSKKN